MPGYAGRQQAGGLGGLGEGTSMWGAFLLLAAMGLGNGCIAMQGRANGRG